MYNKDKIPCEVKTKFDDKEILKYKDEKEHHYKIGENTYTALKQNIPEQVSDITNFTEMNLQNQFDKLFLLQENSGEVARKLNRFINLSIMDQAIKKSKSKVYKKNRDIEYLESELIKLKDDLKKYDWLEGIEELIIKIEKNNNEYEKLLYEIQQITGSYNELLYINNNLLKIDKKLQNKPHFLQIKQSFNLLTNEKNKINDIKDSFEQLKQININLKQYKDIENKKEIIKKLKKEYEELKKINEKIEYLCQLEEFNIEIEKTNKNIFVLKKELKELWKNIKICPLCKQEVKNEVTSI
jgi:hypothetical protein